MILEFNLFVNFWRTVEENVSMTWSIVDDNISILYYFNGENIDLEKILGLLNRLSYAYELEHCGWNLPLTMQKSNSEGWNYGYYKRVEFAVVKR